MSEKRWPSTMTKTNFAASPSFRCSAEICSNVFVSETFHRVQFLCLNLPKVHGVPELRRLSCSGAPQQLQINHARHPIFCPCFLALLAQVTMARKKQDSLKAIATQVAKPKESQATFGQEASRSTRCQNTCAEGRNIARRRTHPRRALD